MSERHDPEVTLPWMRDGTTWFLDALESLEDHEFAHPSGLPGWSRAHVIGHVAGNAEALIRLTSWADTGVECPMYESREQRNSEIESTAAMTPGELRRLSVDTAAALDRALGGLDERGWTATVRSALGRVIPAAEIPWMRIREVWLHAIDIGGTVELGSFPAGIVDLLLDNALVHAHPGPLGVELEITPAAEGSAGGEAVVMCRVVDQGPGLDAGQIATVLEPFVRFGDTGGLGVGLAQAHRLARAAEGSVGGAWGA